MSDQQPLLIVGTGALASLFAARCSATGVPVTMLGTWPLGLAALQTHGVRLVEADGQVRHYPVTATTDLTRCRNAGRALVLVKAWQTRRAAEQLAGSLAPDGLALSLQNGWGNRELLQDSLGADRVALGVTTAGATLLGPGIVRAGGQGPVTVGHHPRLGILTTLLGQAGFQVLPADNMDSLLWGKLVINAAINPLTALLHIPNGQLLASPGTLELAGAAAREAAAVASALHISLPFSDPAMAAFDVARSTAANHSSMLQDITRGAPTEIDAICGAIVHQGAALGVPTPVNRSLWALVRRARQQAARQPAELEALAWNTSGAGLLGQLRTVYGSMPGDLTELELLRVTGYATMGVPVP